jgi:hypothetical protein
MYTGTGTKWFEQKSKNNYLMTHNVRDSEHIVRGVGSWIKM